MNDFFCFSDIGQFYIAATAQRDERIIALHYTV